MDTTLTPTNGIIHHIGIEIMRDPRLKSENSQRGYLADLRVFEMWRDNRPMTKLLVEEYAAYLQQQGRSPNTINRVLASIRWWARKIGDLAFEQKLDSSMREEIVVQSARIAQVKDVSGSRGQRGRHIESGELSALMRACAEDKSPAGIRDAAIIGLAWTTGMRRAEISNLTIKDMVLIGENEYDVIICGKGDKVRTAYIYNGAALALTDWLMIRGNEDGPAFLSINSGGRIQTGHGVGTEALAQMLAKRIRQAGVSSVMWHDFRRTFAGNLLDSGADLVTVQKLLGHSSPATTSNYDRRGDEVKRKAVRILHVPYHKI